MQQEEDGAQHVNHIEIFLFHTQLQLKPNLRSSSRTSVMFGCGSFSTAPPLPTSPANPSSKKSFIHLLVHPAWEEDGDEGWGWAAAMRSRRRRRRQIYEFFVEKWRPRGNKSWIFTFFSSPPPQTTVPGCNIRLLWIVAVLIQ